MAYLIVPLAVLIAVIWALVVFPSFRVVAVILVALGAVFYFWASERAAQEQRQQEAQKKQQEIQKEQEQVAFEAVQKEYCQDERKRWAIVSVPQIEVRGASLKQAPYTNDSYDAIANIKNKSKFNVTALQLKISALDCPTQEARGADCDIIGRGEETFDTDIPAGEVRQITGKVTMPNVAAPRGVFSVRFIVDGVRAALDKSDEAHKDLLAEYANPYKCK